MTAPIQDLRDAIALLQQHDNQYLETDHPVDPNAELAGVYRHIGAGGTVKRPTRIGPAMMFNNIKGYPLAHSGGYARQPPAGRAAGLRSLAAGP
nr:UbiD family decarboxylase [Klebsiella pneumoniae subsp. pneumoniae]